MEFKDFVKQEFTILVPEDLDNKGRLKHQGASIKETCIENVPIVVVTLSDRCPYCVEMRQVLLELEKTNRLLVCITTIPESMDARRRTGLPVTGFPDIIGFKNDKWYKLNPRYRTFYNILAELENSV